MAQAKVLYFSGEIPQGDPEGDQRDLFRKFTLLAKERDHSILAAFLEAVTSSLKEEFSLLSRAQRDAIPAFESVLDLTDHVVQLRKTSLGGAVERVLCFVFQLGSFIAYHEANPLEYNFQPSTTSLIGRGPGLLSAAAIGLSPSITMIPSIAEDITKVQFRFGLIVDQVCRSLEVSPDEINAEGAWIYCAHGAEEADARAAVAKFNTEKGFPETTMATVFNVDGKSVSISGPPSTLKSLFSESAFFKTTKNVPMRKVQGCWHTNRLYGTEHVKQIVPQITKSHRMHIPLYSPTTGKPIEHTEPTALLEQVMEEMLTQSVRWDLTVEGVTSSLKKLSPASTQLIAIQPSHYIEAVLDHWRAEIPAAIASSMDMMTATMSLALGGSRPRDTKTSKIAVVGMGCRFPGGADDIDKFWDLLVQGRDVHAPIPADRFDIATHVDPTGKKHNTSKTPYGCFVDNPGLFDAMFFGMSPREAEQTDPMQRLAMLTAYEALESAGYTHGRGIHARRVGTFYGQASDDYREVNSGQDVSTYFIPGGCRAFGPGRINYFFKFWGPSFSVDTACSSSLAAINAACSSLWAGDCDMAITGGMNILTNSDVFAGLSNGHFLSPTGNCKTWDEGADGYCRADGVGSVVLKRLEDAEADNDNILAVVLAAGTDHSAEAVSITHPHNVAQEHLYNQMVRRAGIDPLSVGYVELHGTGTQAGDKTEVTSVTNVYAPGAPRKVPLHIGSVKSNVGHGEAAAGIMAFIKTMLVFQKGMIPPHVGIKTRFNPKLPQDLAQRNVVIPYNATPWAPNNKHKRIAMVNNFGAAGGNTSIILEEATPRPRTGEDTRPSQVITVSAKTAISLSENLRRLVDYVESNEEVSVADLAYTMSARRNHYNYRVSINASSRTEVINALRPHIESSLALSPHSGKQAPVAFAFTGQGTFYVGIGKQLYRDSQLFRQQIEQLDSLTRRQNFPSFLSIIEGSCLKEDVSTVTMHLAIVCAEIALARLWGSWGLKPSVVIGHSLGEYAALNVAGVLSDSATIFLVATRAVLLGAKCTSYTHGMLSVRASVDSVKEAANGIPFEVACINGANETVLGGSLADLDALSEALVKAGHKTFKLDVAHAYHTTQMETLVDDFVKQTSGVVCKKPSIPIISPRYSKVFTTEDSVDVSYLAGATRETVNFSGALNAAWEAGVVTKSTVWLEMGHHPTCAGFVKRTLPETKLVFPSLHRDSDAWVTISKALCSLYSGGVDIDWSAYHYPFESALRLVNAPTYAWNNKNYWIQYRGDWNLTKGQIVAPAPVEVAVNGFSTTSVHALLQEDYNGTKAKLLGETSITHPSLQEVVDGHAMNGHGVASSFLHADMAFTVAKRILDKALPNASNLSINVKDFEYHEPVVKRLNTSDAQNIRVSAEADLERNEVHIKWYNPAKDLWYAHATVSYEDPATWLTSWARSAKLVYGRVEALNQMAATGKASKVTTDLAYSLFGKLVDYSALYRTMESVILNEDEAVAEVVFPPYTSGDWTVPPHFIDGCVSLSGFILNGGTHFDNTKNFYITPSWTSMRYAKPLLPGKRYTAYCRMIPGEKNSYVGDVYILEGAEIVAVTEAIVFLEWPRVMLNRFFSPPDKNGAAAAKKPAAAAPKAAALPTPFSAPAPPPALTITRQAAPVPDSLGSSPVMVPRLEHDLPTPGTVTPAQSTTGPAAAAAPAGGADDVTAKALVMIAEELAVDMGLLTDEAEIADFGLDSLMSLVLAQKLREDLGIEMRDAFFLEVNTVGELKKMLRK